MFMDKKTQYCQDISSSQSDYNQNSSKLFVDINKLILKFIWRGKRPRTANTIVKEKNKIGGLKLPNFNTYYKATVIMAVCRQERNRQVDQQNRIQYTVIDPHKYHQLIFDKGAKIIQCSKDSLFNKWFGNLDTHMQKNRSRHRSYTFHKS